MGNRYEIRRIESRDMTKDIWDRIPAAAIDSYPWNRNGYMPEAHAQLFIAQTGFHGRLRAYETEIVAKALQYNEYVYTESCMEFFFKPDPANDDRYFNLEFNPFGTAYISLGTDRHDRILVDRTDGCLIIVHSSVVPETLAEYRGPFWEVEFEIPFSFIERYFGKMDFGRGKALKGNFYKCGEDMALPHHGSWNPVTAAQPDFHRPECFGDLIIG